MNIATFQLGTDNTRQAAAVAGGGGWFVYVAEDEINFLFYCILKGS